MVPGCWGAAERAVPRESLSRAPLRHKTELAGAGAPREPGAPRAEQRSSQARSLPPDSSDTISVLYLGVLESSDWRLSNKNYSKILF